MSIQPKLIAASIALLLSACSNESSDELTGPVEPTPLKPEPAQPVMVDLGYANVHAMQESVVIRTLSGEEKLESIDVIKGITFASAERFEHSQVQSLEGDVDATQFGAACPQLKKTTQPQNEDCLNLNVWRPAETQSGDSLPVYVFLHGGDFEYGAGSEPLIHGDTVVAQGIDDNTPFIMVTLNYRLGALGSHWVKGEGVDGNYGLGDQARALEWVQEYIGDFGGDSNNVTIMGQGAGAMSIGLLQQQMLNGELPNHYFQRAIMQSNPYGFEYRSYKSAKSQDNGLDLKDASTEEVLAAQKEVLNPVNRLTGWLTQSIDPLGTSAERTPMAQFMPFSPYMACENLGFVSCSEYAAQPFSEDFAVPTVIGVNDDDANTMTMLPRLTFLIPKILELVQESQPEPLEMMTPVELTDTLQTWLQDEANVTALTQMLQQEEDRPQSAIELPSLPATAYEAVNHLFFGLGNSEQTSQIMAFNDFAPHRENDLVLAVKNMAQFNTLMNDMMFMGPARQKAQESQQPVSLYHFDYKPSFNVWAYNTKGQEGEMSLGDLLKTISCVSGSCHGSELPFVFNKPLRLDSTQVSPSKKDLVLMNSLSRLWFSDSLFEDYQYEPSTDSVMVIDQQGEVALELDWDQYNQAGDDPTLSHGRLNGLQASGLLSYYLVD
jgi:para-nitrobenzyl esterase